MNEIPDQIWDRLNELEADGEKARRVISELEQRIVRLEKDKLHLVAAVETLTEAVQLVGNFVRMPCE